MKPTADQIRQAYAEGRFAEPGTKNPYRGRPLLAELWMSAYLDAVRKRLGISPGADSPVMPDEWMH